MKKHIRQTYGYSICMLLGVALLCQDTHAMQKSWRDNLPSMEYFAKKMPSKNDIASLVLNRYGLILGTLFVGGVMLTVWKDKVTDALSGYKSSVSKLFQEHVQLVASYSDNDDTKIIASMLGKEMDKAALIEYLAAKSRHILLVFDSDKETLTTVSPQGRAILDQINTGREIERSLLMYKNIPNAASALWWAEARALIHSMKFEHIDALTQIINKVYPDSRDVATEKYLTQHLQFVQAIELLEKIKNDSDIPVQYLIDAFNKEQKKAQQLTIKDLYNRAANHKLQKNVTGALSGHERLTALQVLAQTIEHDQPTGVAGDPFSLSVYLTKFVSLDEALALLNAAKEKLGKEGLNLNNAIALFEREIGWQKLLAEASKAG